MSDVLPFPWKCAACYATNSGADAACENCGASRPRPRESTESQVSARPRSKCASCGDPRPSRELTAGGDGLERCTSCHVRFLRERAAPPDDPEVLKWKAELAKILDHNLVKWASRR